MGSETVVHVGRYTRSEVMSAAPSRVLDVVLNARAAPSARDENGISKYVEPSTDDVLVVGVIRSVKVSVRSLTVQNPVADAPPVRLTKAGSQGFWFFA